MAKIAFHCNALGLRGVELSTYRYAHFNEEILKNDSLIVSPKIALHHKKGIKMFNERFKVYLYDMRADLENFLVQEQIDVLYVQKSGENDGIYSDKIKTVIHVVFKKFEPHGHVYAYISEWLTEEMTNGTSPFVPYIVTKPKLTNDLRKDLGIPYDSIVFGRHGGENTFDLFIAKMAVIITALRKPNFFFIFLNTDDFINNSIFSSIQGLFNSNYGRLTRVKNLILAIILKATKKSRLKNIIFLPGTTDEDFKIKFINTCDAMIHGRSQGESFGLACAEFSVLNKPVFTYVKSSEKAHIKMLGKKAILYSSFNNLLSKIETFRKDANTNFDCYSVKFNPQVVMKKFKEVFLD